MEQGLARIETLQGVLRRRELDGAIIAATDHMRYLAGWAEPPGERFLALWVPSSGPASFLVPSLYADDVSRAVPSVPVLPWHDNDGWHRLVLSQARLAETVHRAVVDDDLAAGHLLALQGLAPGIEWCAAGEVMAEIRGVKTPEELTAMERSAAMADSVYAETVFRLEVGIAEHELQSVILDAFRARGASSSWAIVAFGPNSALPHHHSGDRRLQPGDIVVLDLGGCLDGYQSDITRTLAFGFAPPDAAAVYDIVREAHLRVLAVARPGIECQAVDACARAVIELAGYGDRFVHRTGHGIGMSTHEPPNLVAGDATTLRSGMCFSDEPGIYLQGRFGVRIENIIAITEDGARSLNAPAPESLPILEPNSRP